MPKIRRRLRCPKTPPRHDMIRPSNPPPSRRDDIHSVRRLLPVRTKSIPCVKRAPVRTGQGNTQRRTHERFWCAPNCPRAHGDVPHRHIVPRTGGFDGLLHNGAAGQAAVPGGSGNTGKDSHLDGAAAAGCRRGCRAGGGARWERKCRKRLTPGRGSVRGRGCRVGGSARWERN